MNTTPPAESNTNVPEKKPNSRKRKRPRKQTKKQKRLKTVATIAEQLKAEGWAQLDKCPIRFREIEVTSRVTLNSINPLSPLQCFRILWTDAIHDAWISEARANIRHNFRVLRPASMHNTGMLYIGFHLNLIANPAASIRANFNALGVLNNHDVYESLHAARGSINPYNLAQLLSDSFMAAVQIGSHVSIDEIVAESSLDSPAVSVIPRKPHSHGVVVWGAGVKLSCNSPYVIRVVPKTEEFVDWTTQKIVEKLISPINVTHKINFVMDSWFDSAGVKEYINSTPHYYTLGAHSHRDKNFWEWAKTGLVPNTWRQFYNNKTGVLASVFHDTSVHCCSSTAYRTMPLSAQILDRCPLSDAYKAHFNYIDLFDRRFYTFDIPHRAHTINGVLFDALLHVTVINSMVLYNSQQGVNTFNLQEWTKVLSKALLPVV